MKDTGRIKMQDFRGLLYCDAYMNDEFGVDDVEAMAAEIREHYGSHSDIILKKSGIYSVSVAAQLKLIEGVPEFGNFCYVVADKIKRSSAEYASISYMAQYNTQVADSMEQAFELLQQFIQQQARSS